MKTIQLFVISILSVILMTACSKEQQYSNLRVRMTDAPGDFQKVNVEIKAVEIHYTDGDKAWVSLATNAGIYDLLTLRNDVTVVLAENTKIPVGKVDQMRLILGTKNSVMVDDITFELKTPSAQQSGLKINVNSTFAPDKTYDILLDFDAGKSIVIEGNGIFSLKPVITIEGVVEI